MQGGYLLCPPGQGGGTGGLGVGGGVTGGVGLKPPKAGAVWTGIGGMAEGGGLHDGEKVDLSDFFKFCNSSNGLFPWS